MSEPVNPFAQIGTPAAVPPDASIPQGFPADAPAIVPAPLTVGQLAPEYYADPLVTAPGVGFEGWRARFWLAFRNTWKVLLGFAVIGVGAQYALRFLIAALLADQDLGGLVFAGAFGLLIGQIGYAYAFAGSAFVIVKRAAGEMASFGAGARFGLRRVVPVWAGLTGNLVLVGVGAGLLFGVAQCLGPYGVIAGVAFAAVWMIYSTLAGGMIPAIAVTQFDGPPLHTSWKLFNQNFPAASARLLLSRLPDMLPALTLLAVVLFSRFSPSVGGEADVSFVLLLVPLIEAPAWMVLIVGTLVTYAEITSRDVPVLSRDLAFSMDPGSGRRSGLQLRDLSNWTSS